MAELLERMSSSELSEWHAHLTADDDTSGGMGGMVDRVDQHREAVRMMEALVGRRARRESPEDRAFRIREGMRAISVPAARSTDGDQRAAKE